MTSRENLPSRPPSVDDDRFRDLDINDESQVLAAVYQDISIGLAASFDPEPATGDDLARLGTFQALDGEDLDALGIEPDTFGPGVVSRASDPVSDAQPILDGRRAGVAWTYEANNRGALGGLAATGRHVRITGFSFVHSGPEWQVTRYIDWHNVFAQLGVGLAARTIRER